MSNITKFNTTINNLFDDLAKLYPDNKMFIVNKEKFNMLIKYNAKKFMNEFYTHLYKYKNEIINEDENFFLEKISNLENNNLKQIIDLKDLWINLNNDNKKTLWLYFQVLITLIDKEFPS
jgi:hypothetical protein